MKLKKIKVTESNTDFLWNEDLGVFVCENQEYVLESDEANKMIAEGEATFSKEDLIFEEKDDDKESDEDEESDDDDDLEENIKNFGDKKAKPFTKDDAKKVNDDDEEDEESDAESKLKESLDKILNFTVTLDEDDKKALFTNDDDIVISEEVQEKTVTIFESAVFSTVKSLIGQISESYEEYIEESKAQLEKKTQSDVNDYLDYVVSEWMQQNEIAIENSLKLEMNDNFMEGLAGLFKEHYVEVPEGRYDILEGLADKIEDLEGQLAEEIQNNVKLNANSKRSDKATFIESITNDLTESQKEKFVNLVENFKDSDLDVFKSKAENIKESYFSEATVLTEDVDVVNPLERKVVKKTAEMSVIERAATL